MATVASPPGVRACVRCVLDERDDPEISFDANGLCNHCRRYDQMERDQVPPPDVAQASIALAMATVQSTPPLAAP